MDEGERVADTSAAVIERTAGARTSVIARTESEESAWDDAIFDELWALRRERDAVVAALGKPGAMRAMVELTQLVDEEMARVGLTLSRRHHVASLAIFTAREPGAG
jgi:hypothetical protein